ncbi:hypothetical protein O181_130316, partial [Austropuccinia psidii MF-1]|nr:hypothetical protein [Austropuccinia psidii MF-1]
MTIVHKDGNIHKNADGLSRWPLPNNIDNSAYVPEEASPQIPIVGIRLPKDSLRKDLIEIHPTATSFKGMLDKARKHSVRCIKDSFAYAKDKWDKSHATPDFKVGDLVV